jgi:hypothetical protein
MRDGRPFKRKISFHSVDVQTGQLVVFDETIPPEEIVPLVRSSASLPFIFEAKEFEHMYLIDGGTSIINIALADPINRCLDEEGVAPEDIIVDVIICQSFFREVEPWLYDDMSFMNSWNLYKRRESISSYYENFEDFLRVERSIPNVNYRYVVATSEEPPVQALIPIFVTKAQV